VGVADSNLNLTIASQRQSRDQQGYREALQRLLLISACVWPPFVVLDVLTPALTHTANVLPTLLAVRFAGELGILSLYALVRWGKLTSRTLTWLDYVAWLLFGGFVSVMGVEVGGLASKGFAGIMMLVVARAAFVPSPWLRTATTTGMAVLAWPVTLFVAAWFVPAVRAQWSSPAALGELMFGMFFILGTLGMCSAGSHALWQARNEVREARRLGAYRLKMRIGSGANGDVWVAHQDALRRDVALKVLRAGSLATEDRVQRFAREARAAASLDHPNTIRIYEFGASDDGVLFIAMELLDGLDVDALVEMAGPLPPARAVRLVRQACASLAEAHGKGIVHRDIKPGNLFVTHVGEDFDFLKLLDFGVAHFSDGAGPSLTDTGTMLGTPAYMAPEMCAGERATERSDIYSLGAVLYFMLTGTPLFPGRTFSETVMSHISREPQRPGERLGRALPARLEEIVMRCLEKKPSARFGSVSDLEEALAALDGPGEWSTEDARRWWSGARAKLVSVDDRV
jgi:serine/threonine-protein kinase